MSAGMLVEVTTRVFGLGSERKAPPILIPLHERTISARNLIAEHVRGEMVRATTQRTNSLALHYLLADNLRTEPEAATDLASETERAWEGLRERRYLLVVDGATIDDLETELTLTERSAVSFVRLIPLVGG